MSGALRWLGAAFARVQVRFEQGLETFIEGTFRSVVRRALRRRALTVTTGVVVFGLAVAAVVGGHMPFSFLIADQGDRIVAKLTMPFGVPRHDTDRALARLAASSRDLQAELAREYGAPNHHVHRRVARLAPAGRNGRGHGPDGKPTSARSTCSCRLRRNVRFATVEVADAWRAATGPIDGCRAACLRDRLQAGDSRHRHSAVRGQHGGLEGCFRRTGGGAGSLPGRRRGRHLVQGRQRGTLAVAHRRRRRAGTDALTTWGGRFGRPSTARRRSASSAVEGRPARHGSLPRGRAAFARCTAGAPRPHADRHLRALPNSGRRAMGAWARSSSSVSTVCARSTSPPRST